MPQQVPTIQEINDNIIAQLESSLATTIPIFPKAFSRVLAKALAAIFILGYKFAGWICLQLFVSTASYDSVTINGQTFSPLVEWGNLIGVGSPKSATRAEVECTTDTLDLSGQINAGQKLIRPSTGVIYSVIATVTATAGSTTFQCQAVDDDQGNAGFGELGNLNVGDELEFANPLAAFAQVATVSEVLVTAADQESETDYRARVSNRYQRRPQGGARIDYKIWGEETEGIDLVLPYTGAPNEMILYSRSDTEEDGIPTAAQLEAVKQSVLYDADGVANRAPPGVLVTSNPIFRTEVEVEVQGLGFSSSSATSLAVLQGDIEEAVAAHLLSLEPYIMGVSTLPAADRVSSAAIGGIVYEVTEANGAFFGEVVVRIGGDIITTQVLQDGELMKLKEPMLWT